MLTSFNLDGLRLMMNLERQEKNIANCIDMNQYCAVLVVFVL